eukprot:365779-Chlamydomonas_euryale.AAC.7
MSILPFRFSHDERCDRKSVSGHADVRGCTSMLPGLPCARMRGFHSSAGSASPSQAELTGQPDHSPPRQGTAVCTERWKEGYRERKLGKECAWTKELRCPPAPPMFASVHVACVRAQICAS